MLALTLSLVQARDDSQDRDIDQIVGQDQSHNQDSDLGQDSCQETDQDIGE